MAAQEYDFHQVLKEKRLALAPLPITTLQMNITKLCNQTCVHCHVDSSPRRKEMMNDATLQACIEVVAANPQIAVVDITGGAPELHPKFRYLVESLKELDRKVLVRHNLTVSLDPHPVTKEDMSYLPSFFASTGVELVSSLPYYQEFFTDKQRGSGVFKKSIASLRLLNAVGFGMPGSELTLNLIYNPVGAYLPPKQEALERDYKVHLQKHFDIHFSKLFVITNLPIHRFKAQLVQSKGLDAYMHKLTNAFNPAAAVGVMCRDMISVSYDGNLYDCDFNQMLDLKVASSGTTIFDFDAKQLEERQIVFKSHCFGCTAGAGSSCGGATANT